MDTEEKCLVVGLAALALGAVLGWHLRLEGRRSSALGARAAAAGAGVAVNAGPTRFNIPAAGGDDAGCGCS
jgi:hypothetical protein